MINTQKYLMGLPNIETVTKEQFDKIKHYMEGNLRIPSVSGLLSMVDISSNEIPESVFEKGTAIHALIENIATGKKYSFERDKMFIDWKPIDFMTYSTIQNQLIVHDILKGNHELTVIDIKRNHKSMYIAGTIDYIDDEKIIDFKTSSNDISASMMEKYLYQIWGYKAISGLESKQIQLFIVNINNDLIFSPIELTSLQGLHGSNIFGMFRYLAYYYYTLQLKFYPDVFNDEGNLLPVMALVDSYMHSKNNFTDMPVDNQVTTHYINKTLRENLNKYPKFSKIFNSFN